MGYKQPHKVNLSCYGSGVNSLVDATTYYLGYTTLGFTTVTTAGGMISPVNGFIRQAVLAIYFGVAVGTNEDWTVLIRNKTVGTDYTFATVGTTDANRKWLNYSLNIPVSRGDEIFFKTTTPTWVTNPDGCRPTGTITIECE